jgi:hypothetical protein
VGEPAASVARRGAVVQDEVDVGVAGKGGWTTMACRQRGQGQTWPSSVRDALSFAWQPGQWITTRSGAELVCCMDGVPGTTRRGASGWWGRAAREDRTAVNQGYTT